MNAEKPLRRAGWRGVVYDSPLCIVIAFVLAVAGILASCVIAGRSGLGLDAPAYLLVFGVCLTPVAIFYALVFRRKPIWLPVLVVWLTAGFIVVTSEMLEWLGLQANIAKPIVGSMLCLLFSYAKKYWPRLERYCLGQQPGNTN